jgi:hypothetical protein
MNAAFLNVDPAVAPGIAAATGTRDLVRLLSLDLGAIDRPRLACRWHRDAEDRLACRWEPVAPPSARPASEFRRP